MENHMDYILLIAGSFISLLLMVNAFFTRKTLEKISTVELQLAVLISKHDNTDERSKANEFEIRSLRDRMHKVEGSTGSAVNLLKHYASNNKQ